MKFSWCLIGQLDMLTAVYIAVNVERQLELQQIETCNELVLQSVLV